MKWMISWQSSRWWIESLPFWLVYLYSTIILHLHGLLRSRKLSVLFCFVLGKTIALRSFMVSITVMQQLAFKHPSFHMTQYQHRRHAAWRVG